MSRRLAPPFREIHWLIDHRLQSSETITIISGLLALLLSQAPPEEKEEVHKYIAWSILTKPDISAASCVDLYRYLHSSIREYSVSCTSTFEHAFSVCLESLKPESARDLDPYFTSQLVGELYERGFIAMVQVYSYLQCLATSDQAAGIGHRITGFCVLFEMHGPALHGPDWTAERESIFRWAVDSSVPDELKDRVNSITSASPVYTNYQQYLGSKDGRARGSFYAGSSQSRTSAGQSRRTSVSSNAIHGSPISEYPAHRVHPRDPARADKSSTSLPEHLKQVFVPLNLTTKIMGAEDRRRHSHAGPIVSLGLDTSHASPSTPSTADLPCSMHESWINSINSPSLSSSSSYGESCIEPSVATGKSQGASTRPGSNSGGTTNGTNNRRNTIISQSAISNQQGTNGEERLTASSQGPPRNYRRKTMRDMFG